MEGCGSYVFEGVRGQGAGPGGLACAAGGSGLAGVECDCAAVVAAEEVAPCQDGVDGGPLVGVEGGGLAGVDDGFQDADLGVFEEEFVVGGGGGEGV